MNNSIFLPANILLPDFNKIDGTKWACIACDQFTSEPEYWETARSIIGNAPSTLNLMIPEVYLDKTDEMLPSIQKSMVSYLKNILIEYKDSLIYLERTLPCGKIRKGIIGMIDLEAYDYNVNSNSPIRATEKTVIERIPPRVAVRKDAEIELPHIMLLIDDKSQSIIEPLEYEKNDFKIAYDFELMSGSGHVKGYFLNDEYKSKIIGNFDKISQDKGFLFAVGDGNHSLATAKTIFEKLKVEDYEKAMKSPERYALAEVVNLYDSSIEFEPIYRIVTDVNQEDIKNKFKLYVESLHGKEEKQVITVINKNERMNVEIKHPEQQLAIGTLQIFLDEYLQSNPKAKIDYIHGEDSVKMLSEKENTVGFLFKGIRKDELFNSVYKDGSLPRKTFSMGTAKDKRFYIECRKIK